MRSGLFAQDDLVKVEKMPLEEALTHLLSHVYGRRGNRTELESLRSGLGVLLAELNQEIAALGKVN